MSKCQHFFISFRRRVSKKIFCMGLFKIEDIYFNRPNNLEDLRHTEFALKWNKSASALTLLSVM
jgi:hypothetical protein